MPSDLHVSQTLCKTSLCFNNPEIHLQDSCKPVMTAYKLMTIDAPYWGFGRQLEQAMLAVHLFDFTNS